jgi:hypothetical protein
MGYIYGGRRETRGADMRRRPRAGGATAYGTSGDVRREGNLYTISAVSVKVNLKE